MDRHDRRIGGRASSASATITGVTSSDSSSLASGASRGTSRARTGAPWSADQVADDVEFARQAQAVPVLRRRHASCRARAAAAGGRAAWRRSRRQVGGAVRPRQRRIVDAAVAQAHATIASQLVLAAPAAMTVTSLDDDRADAVRQRIVEKKNRELHVDDLILRASRRRRFGRQLGRLRRRREIAAFSPSKSEDVSGCTALAVEDRPPSTADDT